MAQFGNATVYAVDYNDVIGGTPSYTAVASITGLDLSGPSTDLLDGTEHGDEWRERVGGLTDAGTLTATARFDTVSHAALLAHLGTLFAHRVTFPKRTGPVGAPFSIASDGYLTGVGISAPHDGLLEANITVQLTGEPVIVEEVGIASVAINQASQTLTHPDTLQLTATVVASGGASTAVTYASSNAAAATVTTPGGLISTVAAGVAVITCTSAYDTSISDSITITVA